MEKAEIIQLISVCSANYKNWPEAGKEDDTILLWEMMLMDMPFNIAKMSVQYHLSSSPYPPTIAHIRETAAKVSQPRTVEAIEAWEMVCTAIRKFGFYRELEGMASLPDDVARMAKRFSWRELCLNENVDTLRAQFRMAWETQSKRKQEQNILPDELVNMIESTNLLKRLV